MAVEAAAPEEGWPSGVRVDVARIGPEDASRPVTVVARHPGVPFVRSVASLDGRPDEAELRRAAWEYLLETNRREINQVGAWLPSWWLEALGPGASNPHFGWVPLPPRSGAVPALASVVAESGRPRAVRSVVLLAAEQFWGAFPSEFGLRVVARIRAAADGRVRVSFTGVTASLPYGPYQRLHDFAASAGPEVEVDRVVEFLRGHISRTLVLRQDSLTPRGFRPGFGADGALRQFEVRWRGLAASPSPGAGAEPQEVLVVVQRTGDGEYRIVSQRRFPLVSCAAAAQARTFRCDPMTYSEVEPPPQPGHPKRTRRGRRPTRSDEALDWYREWDTEAVPLEVAGRLTVRQSAFVLGDDPKSPSPKTVPLPSTQDPDLAPRVRRDDFTAVSAFHNVGSLFDRFDLYGIDPDQYFQLAALPLEVFYRSGIHPGPGKDGQTVNGRVLPKGWPPDAISTDPTSGSRPALEIHLALGDLSTRWRKPRPPGDLGVIKAEPLGFATDPRWIWHELAHVLLMATTGELEFRFAHSMGDALAAISTDPQPLLTDDPDHARGITFPWVFAPRRHDRCVLHGWGWAGSLGRALRERPDAERLRRKGYASEQILSTSLFRLYRCLGGDTASLDPLKRLTARERAADYAMYLIIEAVRLLGDARVVPARQAEQFEEALEHADTHAGASPTDLAASSPPWNGGCAHKVVRWAFEAQGMFQEGAAAVTEAPGRPPLVDLYILDRRPREEPCATTVVRHGPGGYVPVSLDWDGLDGTIPDGGLPLWFAADAAMGPSGSGFQVTVANRGAFAADGAVVELWHRPWPAGSPVPLWKDGGWTLLETSQPRTVQPGGSEVVGFSAPPAGRALLLAAADCLRDQANTNPATGYECSLMATPLAELVAGDNNLGIFLVEA